MDMLEEATAAYLTIAPLAVLLALGVVAAAWYAGARLAPGRVRIRTRRPPV